MDMPNIENWPQLRAFAAAVHEISTVYTDACRWSLIAQQNNAQYASIFDLEKGYATGLWLKDEFTDEQKQEIIRQMVIARLEQ